ncbi:MAG: TetR/AcrR family transcriptional regulator [Acidobacteriota bacterium]
METKTALLDSAEKLARMRGYDAFSYADLAREVGIRKASIHHHFPSKADLALALVKRYRSRFAQALEGIAQRHRTAGRRLTEYFEVYRQALSGGQTVCLCVAFSAGRNSLSTEVLAELAAFDRASRDWLAEIFRLGRYDGSIANVGDPRAEAAACLALAEGAQLQACSSEDVERFDAAIQQMLGRLR